MNALRVRAHTRGSYTKMLAKSYMHTIVVECLGGIYVDAGSFTGTVESIIHKGFKSDLTKGVNLVLQPSC